jgi:ABC-type multidrug transport system fused ATPase/permease subunit
MIALVLSILLPGLGQFYYGKNIRAICMVLLGLTPLYPAVLIWTIIDIIILNKKGAVPKYTKKDAAWAIVLLVLIIPVFISIAVSGLYAVGSWYSDKYVFPEQTMTEGRQIATAIIEFHESHGKFPDSIKDIIKNYPLRSGWIVDGWKEPYIYEIIENEGKFRVISKGRDKALGTDDDMIFN